jgi:uncharacterized protein YraI
MAQTPPPEAAGIPASVYQTSNLRAAPDMRAEIVGRVPADASVTARGRSEDGRWLWVESDEGLRGWLPSFVLALAGDAGDLPPLADAPGLAVTPGGAVLVTAVGRVNVRTQPRIGDNIVGQLNGGQQAEAVARSSQGNDWLLIELDELRGWVAYFAVRVVGDPSALPVLTPDSSDTLVPPSLQVTTRFNARLRAAPSSEAEVAEVVPFGASVTLLGRTEASDWVQVRYESLEGWIDAALIEAPPDQIAALPVVELTTEETTVDSP